jgi:hypothetical protein
MFAKRYSKISRCIVVALFIFTFTLSSCSKSKELVSTQTNSPSTDITSILTSTPTLSISTPLPKITVTINEISYTLSHPLLIKEGLLWLPSVEIFELINRQEVSLTEDFLSTSGKALNGLFSNCHFWIGRTGENTYTADTEGNIWFESDLPPFKQDGEVYLSEKMIEDCAGEFIQFDQFKRTVNLLIADKAISSMQMENNHPISFFALKDSSELNDSRIGVLVSGMVNNPASEWVNWAKRLKLFGFTRARVTLNASDGPAVDPDRLGDIEKFIPPEYDEIYKAMKDQGIVTRYSLSFWDLENRQYRGSISYKRLSSDEEIQRYLDYVRMVVTSLKGLVDEYELWNEPDANRDWYQRIEPEDYIKVAKLAIPIIREVDPQAKVVLISTSSYVDQPCQEYSKIILESDVISMVDAISLHTVNNDASPDFLSDYYYGYEDMWKDIKKMAEENGFIGEYYADELNYRSDYSLSALQPEPGNYHPYEPEIAAKYFARMIAINLGMDISVGTSGTNEYERPIEAKMIQNMAYLMDGLQASPFEVTVESDSELIRYYTFSDLDGNTYIVIWNDAEATVTSMDILASISFLDQNVKSIISYDPYLMYQHNLDYSSTSDGIKLDGLLIKDYPLFYKIQN